MVLSTAITTRLAHLLGVPRKYAVRTSDGQWRRVHEDLTIEDFHRRLTTEPLCVAIKDSNLQPGESGYKEGQTFAIFDVDAEDNFEGAKAAALDLANGLIAEGIPFLVTFSGKKGFHIWIFFNAEVCCANVRDWQVQFLAHLEYAFVSANHYGKAFGDGPVVDVDILHAAGMGYVVKVPFSRHQARAGFFEIPIAVADISAYDKNTPPTEAQWAHAVEVFQLVQQADPVLVLLSLPPSAQTRTEIQNIRPTLRGDNEEWCYTIPEHSARLDRRNADILRMINAVPCVKEVFRRCVELDHIYKERTYLVKFLKKKRVKRNEVLYFIRYKINDEEDNQHPNKLIYYTNYWYDNRTGENGVIINLCRCSKMQNELHACPEGGCVRTDPAAREPPYRIPRDDWVDEARPISTVFDEFLASPDVNNLQAFANTRSRKTTEAVLSTIRAGMKVVVLVPRLKIAKDTGQDILNRAAEQGHEVYSCIVPDNRKLCLVLAHDCQLTRERHDTPEGELSAFEILPHVDKPSCSNCAYRFAHEPEIQPNIIYGESDVERHICGYQTILNYAEKWNVVWISNAKYTSVNMFKDTYWEVPIRRDILSNAKVCIVDEVGDIVQTPSFTMPVYWLTTDETPFEFWFIRNLNEEIRQFNTYLNTQRMGRNRGHGVLRSDATDAAPVREHDRIQQTNDVTARLGEEIRVKVDQMRQNPDDDVLPHTRDVNEEEMEELKRASRLISKGVVAVARDNDVALVNLQYLLALGQQLQWIFTNVPTEDRAPYNISVLVAPKVAEFMAEVPPGTKILALDAVPPIVSLDAIFEHPFKKVNFGDPAHTNEKFLIVPDTKHISSTDLRSSDDFIHYMKSQLYWMDIIFGQIQMGVLTTSKKMADWTQGAVSDLRDLDMLYHRGSQTIGVAYPRRIGISMCAPNPPTNSNHWMKVVYPVPLQNVSPTQLQKHDQARQTMQAEGRFKDPQNEVYSGVFAFGQTSDTVAESYINSPSPPRIAKTLKWSGASSSNLPSIGILQLALWIKPPHILVEERKDLTTITQIVIGREDGEAAHYSGSRIERCRELREALRQADLENLRTRWTRDLQ